MFSIFVFIFSILSIKSNLKSSLEESSLEESSLEESSLEESSLEESSLEESNSELSHRLSLFSLLEIIICVFSFQFFSQI